MKIRVHFIFIAIVLLAGCVQMQNKVIVANENHISISPRNNMLYESDRVAASGETAMKHCKKYGKTAVLESVEHAGRFIAAVKFRCE